jgi:subtilisin-like proprotein convertase family protein
MGIFLLVTAIIFVGKFSQMPNFNSNENEKFDAEEFSEESKKAFDKPAEAAEFYRMKRLPVGETQLPLERYLTAREKMKQMPLYSSTKQKFIESPEDALSPDAVWSPLGPGNVGGRTRGLLVHPTNPSIMYAAGVAGGVWKSTDGGANWTPLNDMMANLAVTCLAFDPTNPNIIYAGTGEGYGNSDAVRGLGIFKTTDGGTTWTQLPSTINSNFFFVNDIVVSNVNSNRVYAATSTGILRSLDGGANWAGLAATGCTDLVIRTDQPTDYVFLACGNSFTTGIVYRNTDAGGFGTWTGVLSETGMGRTSLALAPSDQNVIYALSASNSAGTFENGLHAVYRSTSGGTAGTWEARVRNTNPVKLNTLLLTNPIIATLSECGQGSNQFFNQGWYDNVIAVDPANPNIVWTGGIDLFRSDDGGLNWGLASHWWAAKTNPRYSHADQHAIVFHPQFNGTTNRTMFVGNDGGLFRTTDSRAATATGPTATCSTNNGSVTWTSLNNGYGVTQFYHGVPYPNGTTYFGGTQDNGTVRGTDGSPNAWTDLIGGDGGYVAVDSTNTNVLYGETTGISIRKSTDGGVNFASATTGISDQGLFINPFIMDPGNSQRLWTGGSRMWRTTNAAGSWTQASATLGGNVSAIAVSPSDGNYVLAGSANGFIARTDIGLSSTAATTWLTSTPRSGYVSWVTFDPTNRNIAYATYSNFGGTHVWRSTNGGATWTGIDGSGATGIPDIPVHSIIVDPSNTSRLYVGTDLGVFVSLNSGATWAVENTGFANVVTESLAMNGSGSNLFAFTHGRGAWRMSLGGGTAGTVQFSSATYSVNENGGTATITVTRTGGTSAFSVNYATSNGTATAGLDYTAASGTLNFADGETSKTFNVSIIDDTLAEPNETVNLALSGPTNGATIGTPGTAVLTIVDNDGICTYQVNPTSRNVPQTAGSSSVDIVTPAGCPWTATVNAPGLAEANFLTQTPDLFSLTNRQTVQSKQSTVELAPNVVFSNNSPITINDRASNTGPPGTASLYPSNITVSGLTGTVTQVKVTLNGLSHTFPDDIDILLVAPGGQRSLLMSDAGGGSGLTNVNVTFDQSAATTIPDNSQITTGNYRPGNYAGNTTIEPGGVDNFPSPGPGQTTYNPDLSVFNGISPNGTWQLYVVDDENVDSGAMASGWSLDITTSGGGSSWITLNQPTSGLGAGTVTYNYTANPGASSRSGQVLINGVVIHTVNQAGTTPVTRKPFDYDGDGKTDISIFRPSNGQWWINWSSNNSTKVYQFGQNGDSIVPADYTGDGRTDIAFWRAGTWFILRSENDTFFAAPFGTIGDIPAPGDFDADGRADLAVFRPTAATWFILGTTQGNIIRQWGTNGDVPVVGDYDGDGRSDIAIFRPSNGSWWVSRSTAGNLVTVFGAATDKPVPADYTGDGKTDIAFWQPTTGTWFILRSEDLSFYAAPFGANGDIPASGDYDGDNRADLAVFRPTAATWFILRTTQGSLIQAFGANGDRPTPAAFVP